jgi:TldD protein
MILFGICASLWAQEQRNTSLIEAVQAEKQRGLTLKLPEQESPYFIEYRIREITSTSVYAGFGVLESVRERHYRPFTVEVRVGNYDFDNGNFDGSMGSNNGVFRSYLPLEDHKGAIQKELWYGTDITYKGATEEFSGKLASKEFLDIKTNVDLLPMEKIQYTSTESLPVIDLKKLKTIAKELSSLEQDIAKIEELNVAIVQKNIKQHVISTENNLIQTNTSMYALHVEAIALNEEGSKIRGTSSWIGKDISSLPPMEVLRKESLEMIDFVIAQKSAPIEEDYLGPVLFSPEASVELFRQLLPKEISANPPLNQPPDFLGEVQMVIPDSRVGRRLLPEGWDVIDDPVSNKKLDASYLYDDQGVAAQKVLVIENGVVKNLLMSRIPREGFDKSTGHARMLRSKRAVPMQSNVFITPNKNHSMKKLQKKGLRLAQQADLDYILYVRHITPLSLNEDFEIAFSGDGPLAGLTRPLEVVRLYKDGHEEIVRGMQFVGVNRNTLKDIVMAGPIGETVTVLDGSYGGDLYQISPTNGLLSTWSVPAVLVSEVELKGNTGKEPHVLSPPPITKE